MVKSTMEILQNFVAFSEYMNINKENSLVVDCMKLSVIVHRSWQNTKQQYQLRGYSQMTSKPRKILTSKNLFRHGAQKVMQNGAKKGKRWREKKYKKPTIGYVDYENPFGLVRPIILYGPYA